MADERLRLIAVHAHPDDESSKGAATMARYVAEGVDVMVVTCTGGERGDVLNPNVQSDPEIAAHLPELRRREMAEASEILGVRHRWLGFVDSGLPKGDPPPPLPEGCFALQPLDVAAERLVRIVREFRPHVMTTYDPNGGYPHPDHIMTHRVSMEAFEGAGDPDRFPGAGPAWRPLKLYYNGGWSRSRIMALHEAMLAAGVESPFTEMLEHLDERQRRPERAVTTHIRCDEYFPLRRQALLAHRTQIDPDGRWFNIPYEIERAVWPNEDFELARSLVHTTVPEDDLFAGIRAAVPAEG